MTASNKIKEYAQTFISELQFFKIRKIYDTIILYLSHERGGDMKVYENEEVQSLIDELDELSVILKDEDMYKEKLRFLEELADTNQDILLKANVKYFKATIPYEHEDYEACRKYILEALNIGEDLNFDYMKVRCYNTLAIIDSKQADYCSSISNYLKAYLIAEQHKEYKFSFILLNNIGNLFVWLGEYEIALSYLIKSYDKYFEEEEETTYYLDIIHLNIVEVYSILREYDKLEVWKKFEITNEEIGMIMGLIFTVNEIDKVYRKEEFFDIEEKMQHILTFVCNEGNFIYVFRCLLRVLEYTIDAKDQIHAKQLIERMEEIKDIGTMETFRYDHIKLLYRYYEIYEEASTPDSMAKRILKDYVKQSEHELEQMQNNYTRRLLIETEMVKIQNEKDAIDKSNLQLKKDIELDYFTGILNKVSFEKHYEERMKQLVPQTFQALYIMDIDHFKEINDTYGHERGDEILLEVVRLISAGCSSKMLFGRFGGDEFLLYVEDIKNVNYASAIASELMENAHGVMVDKACLSFSIGVYIMKEQTGFKEAFSKVDEALYEAKHRGRDQYVIYGE